MKQTRPKPQNISDEGFALPLVITVGAILLIGGFALIARTFGGLLGSIRTEQARQAREIAKQGWPKH